MKAIISDIHSNLEALQAVLKDIEKHPVTAIYCLGDVVGYGPNPRECVDVVMKCEMVLLGNHDQGALFDPDGFNPPAERAIFWTRDQLESCKNWATPIGLMRSPRSHWRTTPNGGESRSQIHRRGSMSTPRCST